jgi:ElaB/YqjD/DUF883 family membrane-anchored ribosome-binding protein
MEDRVRSGGMVGEHPVGEWVRSEARDLADAARQRMHGAKEHAGEAKEYLQGAVEQTKEYIAGARGYVEGSVQQARGKMTEYREGGIEKVQHDVTGYTRAQPMTALLIAAGAGLLLGWLSAAGRR